MGSRNSLESWQRLESLAVAAKEVEIKNLFASDSQRFEKYSIEDSGILFDFSKNNLSNSVKDELLRLARACQLEQWRSAMFSGEKINSTENHKVNKRL